MLKFSILVLTCLYSQACGLYFGRYDVLVRTVEDLGGGATRRDASNLIPVIPNGLNGNEKSLAPNVTQLTVNYTGGVVFNEPVSNFSEVVKNAVGELGNQTEKAGETIAAAVATAAAVKAAAAASEDTVESTIKNTAEDYAPVTCENCSADNNGAGAATDNAEETPIPTKSKMGAKRFRRKSRLSRKSGRIIDYDYEYDLPQSTKRPYTGIVGVDDDFPVFGRPSRPSPPHHYIYPNKM